MSNKDQLFQEIIDKHKDKIYRICYAYLYNKKLVDDLFQDVLINIWNALDRFKGEAQITTWLYRITMNTTITFNKNYEKQKKLFTNEIPLNIKDECAQTSEIHNQQKIDKLMQSIQKLKKDERLIISFVLEELSYKEVAEILGISVNSVGVKINRIKKRLLGIYKNG
ncbi:MAG: sigma-70 family RNA polymerase sigma factor [Calditrichaeota bacterium]|nr:sigma-70 family RNA polymerase sigma factor [Calditrichota bacterium]